MNFATRAAATLVSFIGVLATAASAETHDATIPPVRVRVVVTSKYYGSFTEERDVKVNQTVSFNNLSAHHSGVFYQGKCTLTLDPIMTPPADIDDGVVVNITPITISPDGIFGATHEIKVTKFIRYDKFNSKTCGDISFARSSQHWTRSDFLYQPGQVHTVDALHQYSVNEGDRDLLVTVSFSPATASAQ